MRNTYEEGQDYARYTEMEYGLGRIREDLKVLVRSHLDNDFDLGYYDECVRIDAVETAVAEAQREVLEAVNAIINNRMEAIEIAIDSVKDSLQETLLAQYSELLILAHSLEVK